MKNAGLLSLETIRFIRKAIENDFEFQRILENTENVSHSLSINLSSQAIEEIKHLKGDDLNSFSKLPSPSVISALNKIILDGRFIDSWQSNLDEVVSQLDINLTPQLRKELMSTSLNDLYQNNLNEEAQASVATTAAGVVAAVVVGAAVAHRDINYEEPVLDFSNIPKF